MQKEWTQSGTIQQSCVSLVFVICNKAGKDDKGGENHDSGEDNKYG